MPLIPTNVESTIVGIFNIDSEKQVSKRGLGVDKKKICILFAFHLNANNECMKVLNYISLCCSYRDNHIFYSINHVILITFKTESFALLGSTVLGLNESFFME